MGAHSNYISVDGDFATALWFIALVITVITLAMIVKVVKTIIEIVKTTKLKTEEKEAITSDSSKENFSYNLIEEDIASLNIPLSDEASKLISTYRD